MSERWIETGFLLLPSTDFLKEAHALSPLEFIDDSSDLQYSLIIIIPNSYCARNRFVCCDNFRAIKQDSSLANSNLSFSSCFPEKFIYFNINHLETSVEFLFEFLIIFDSYWILIGYLYCKNIISKWVYNLLLNVTFHFMVLKWYL